MCVLCVCVVGGEGGRGIQEGGYKASTRTVGSKVLKSNGRFFLLTSILVSVLSVTALQHFSLAPL